MPIRPVARLDDRSQTSVHLLVFPGADRRDRPEDVDLVREMVDVVALRAELQAHLFCASSVDFDGVYVFL